MFGRLLGATAAEFEMDGLATSPSIRWSIDDEALKPFRQEITADEGKGALAAAAIAKLVAQMGSASQQDALTRLNTLIWQIMPAETDVRFDSDASLLVPRNDYVSALPNDEIGRYSAKLRVKSGGRVAVSTGISARKGERGAILACLVLTEACLRTLSPSGRKAFLLAIGVPITKGVPRAGYGRQAADVAGYVALVGLLNWIPGA